MSLLEIALDALLCAKALCEETGATETNCYASALTAIAAIKSYADTSIEPVAHVVTHTTGGNAGLAKHIHWLPHSQSVMLGDLLYLHPTPAPEGMAIVPLKPTRAMCKAATSYTHSHDAKLIYKAMLAAAKEKGE